MERPENDIRLADALRIFLEDLESAGIDRIRTPSVQEVQVLESYLTIVPSHGTPSNGTPSNENVPPRTTDRTTDQATRAAPITQTIPRKSVPISQKISMPQKPKTNPQTASIQETREKVAAAMARSNQPEERLSALAQVVHDCALCPMLVSERTNTVFGSGNPNAELIFIGEGPGADEDAQGLPFVGRSGKLLTDIIEKGMGISRSEVYICNIVRCRPPGNRRPTDEEAACCRPFLDATLEVIHPKYLCLLGATAAQNLLGTTESIGKLRGHAHEYRGAQVICTYHPSYLLRNPAAKRDTWEDIKLLLKVMGREVPK